MLKLEGNFIDTLKAMEGPFILFCIPFDRKRLEK